MSIMPTEWQRLSQIWAKSAQNDPKMGFSQFWWKSSSLMCTFYCLKVLMVLYHSEKTTCLGKIWFSSYGPKRSWPIRLHESLITYISWRGWSLTLIFCMLVDIHERKRLSATLRVGHAQTCPGMPDFACGASGLLEGCSESGNNLI